MSGTAPAPGGRVAVACAVCGGRRTRPFALARYAGRDEDFPVVRCRDCGFVYVNPRLARVQVEDDYASRAPVPEAQGRRVVASQAAHHRFLLARIEAEAGSSGGLRLLEVGAGWGGFLDEARKRGHRVSGVDISRARVGFAREILGLEVREGDVFRPDLERGAFDVVFCAHTLEHLFDPRAALVRMRELLRPGGLLCLAVPNLRYLGGRRRRGRMTDDPRHLSHFRSATLERILRETGYRPGSITSGLLLFGLWNRLLPEPAARVAAGTTLRLTGWLGGGSEITAFARRPAH